MTAARELPPWGELSPALRALSNDRQRRFVYHYVLGRPTRGAADAYRAAGYNSATPLDQARDAFKLLCDERIMAAVAELSKKHFRAAIPEAVQAVREIINDPAHRDRARVSMALIDRVDPIVARTHLEVSGRVTLSADEEALEELAAVRKLGVTRDKLLELFGGNYLPRLEQLEAAKADRAKVIDVEATEVDEPSVAAVDETNNDDMRPF